MDFITSLINSIPYNTGTALVFKTIRYIIGPSLISFFVIRFAVISALRRLQYENSFLTKKAVSDAIREMNQEFKSEENIE